ncbi:MAG TPA: GNAT family N-acetyltransferase [Flavisolibacter sp.]|nr:GNAT family N-acetyltransferase [Flavisolibacter sp.]
MIIQHRENPHRGIFFVEDEGEMLAEIVYTTRSDNTLIIEHTDVDDDLRGQNIGYELVHKTVDYARMHGMKISPVCPFAKAIFDKKADWQDMLA